MSHWTWMEWIMTPSVIVFSLGLAWMVVSLAPYKQPKNLLPGAILLGIGLLGIIVTLVAMTLQTVIARRMWQGLVRVCNEGSTMEGIATLIIVALVPPAILIAGILIKFKSVKGTRWSYDLILIGLLLTAFALFGLYVQGGRVP